MPGGLSKLFGNSQTPAREEASAFTRLFAPLGSEQSQEEAKDEPQHEPAAVKYRESAVYWGMRNLPIGEAKKHFFLSGATGSGKTVAIDLFLQSIAPRFRASKRTNGGSDQARGNSPSRSSHLIIFDAKGDVVQKLAAMGIVPEDHSNYWIMQPFLKGGSPWNIADAARRPALARYIASLLIPDEPNATAPYFTNAARDLLLYAMWGLTAKRADKWTFRDLLCALDSKEHILRVTACHPRAQRLAGNILEDTQHCMGVLSSLTTKLGKYEEVAALWHSSGKIPFSITRFMEKPGVLVLGSDPVFHESLWPINAIILKAVADEVLRKDDTLSDAPYDWFVLDEFRSMRDAKCVQDLLNRGRSKGASVLIAIQSMQGLVEVYGEAGADELVSSCANKVFLRTGDPKTAEWNERFFNKIREKETVFTETFSGSNSLAGALSSLGRNSSGSQNSRSYQYQLQDRPMFLASYFLNLPFTGSGRPYKAVCDLPCLDCTLIVERSFAEIEPMLVRPRENVDAATRVDSPKDEILKEWDPKEVAFFPPVHVETEEPPQTPSQAQRVPMDSVPSLKLSQ